ncbi:MAG: DnaD domain protein [Clostridiales bacterium]|nr:DnaD domain protein [Clostridiales bacterium]
MKNSFVVYNEIEQQTAMLDDAQLGQLFRAMVRYNQGKEPDIADPLVCVAFGFIKTTMDRDRAKYEETCAKRKVAGAKGGRPKKNQTAESGEYPPAKGGDFFSEKQKVFSKPDNVPVNVNEHDNVPVNVSVPVSVYDSQDEQDGQTVDCDRDCCERDYQDVLNYATKKVGYSFTNKQKKQLKRWCSIFPFDVVIMAFDRSMLYNARSVSYTYQILEEWQNMGLKDYEQVSAYVAEREGGESA